MSKPSSDERMPARRRFWATRVFALLVIVFFVCSHPALHDINAFAAHLATLSGVILAAVGALGRLWCSSYIAGNKNSRLVVEGPYSLVRNPLYAFSYIGGLGIAITTETLTIPVAFTAWFFWFHGKVVAGEERFLGAKFRMTSITIAGASRASCRRGGDSSSPRNGRSVRPLSGVP